MSTFSGLTGALSALHAQRRAMDVTGQNIANANTDGYSRQRVNLEATGGSSVPAIYSTPNGANGGVTVTDVTRIQDAFLEARARIEHGQSAYLAGQQQVYSRLEQVFKEPSDTGLQKQLSEFWSSWHDLVNRPGDPAARSQVLATGTTLANTIQSSYATLGSLWGTTREQLDGYVTDLNGAAARVAQLNQAIVRNGQAGQPANELADQRDLLIMHISELTGASALARPDGSVDVFLGGSPLVSGASFRQLSVTGAQRMADQGASPVQLVWDKPANTPAAVTSGSIAAAMETLSTTLPGIGAGLDAVTATLANTVNAQHKLGQDPQGDPGEDFFTSTKAVDFAVAITDTNKIAAAKAGAGPLDSGNADALAALATAANGADREYRQFIINLGSAKQTVDRRMAIQDVVTTDVDSARSAQSGVNLDEEMTNLISYQRAYQAASRVMTTVDDMLDTLINRTGLVGR
ncbi:flagellar hook-associated protein FlgK [Planosporangium sp. 12N6]|uniref:flagellar hook-associated protein FlgK n=1 Tax=Planosporangium spinosum TaxID=3402278 RepID=UPI003CF2B19D